MKHPSPPKSFLYSPKHSTNNISHILHKLSQSQLFYNSVLSSDSICFSKMAHRTPTHIFENCMRTFEVQQWGMMEPCSLQIACLCWLQPQGHLAHFLLCCEEVQEAWRSEDLTNKLPSVVVAGAGQTAAEDQRGSMTVCFCFSGKIQHILFSINNRATIFTYLLLKEG